MIPDIGRAVVVLYDEIISTIQHFHPDVQAVYLFGSYGTEYERADSDVDLALLLPHESAKLAGSLSWKDCRSALENLLNRSVDLINLRLVNTVFQNRIVQTGKLILAQIIESKMILNV